MSLNKRKGFIVDLLNSWTGELEWKGVFSEKFDDCYIVHHEGQKTSVQIMHSDSIMFSDQSDTKILVFYDDVAPDECTLDADIIFNVYNRTLTGNTNMVAEDLRDYLRRHTLGCGTDKVFQSIEPRPFKKLKHVSI